MTYELGPLPDTELSEVRYDALNLSQLSKTGTAYWGSNWREVRKLYTAEKLRAYALAEVEAAAAKERAIWAERDDIHTESSRIYAKLATAVHSGADSVTLGVLLRREVNERTARAQRG